MDRLSAGLAGLTVILCLAPTIALAQIPDEPPPFGGHIENIPSAYETTQSMLIRALSLECIDPDVRDYTVAYAQKVIAQLRDAEKRLDFGGRYADRLGYLVGRLLFKPPCPPPAAAPQPVIEKPRKPCRTPEQEANLTQLHIDLTNLEVDIESLRDDVKLDERLIYNKEEQIKRMNYYIAHPNEERTGSDANGTPQQIIEENREYIKESREKIEEKNEQLKEKLKVHDEIERQIELIEQNSCPGQSMLVPSRPDTFVTGRPFTGLNSGISIEKSVNFLTWIESVASSGEQTSQNSARGDPLGAGIYIGYGFKPWAGVNNLVVNPFLSLDYPNSSVKYLFPSGSFIGAKNNFEGTAGVKIGPANQFAWLYLIAGVSFLNEKLTVNFSPISSSTTATVPGATFGAGVAFQPKWLQVFGYPTSLSLEWQHSWWQTANFNMPASSPFFNYAFKREDDRIMLGVNFYLSR
jgi:hypothetical protein